MVDLLVRERNQDVVLSAGTRGHVHVLSIKLVVASLGAPDQLSKRVVLQVNSSLYYFSDSQYGIV